MKADIALQKIIDDIVDFKKTNQSVVAVDALIAYLSVFKKDVSEQEHFDELRHSAQLEEYKAKNASQLAEYEAQNSRALAMFDSVISYGQMSLKSAILINGGAAVAILALIGNIWSQHISPPTVELLARSILLFSLAALGGAFGIGCTYLCQKLYAGGYRRLGHTLTGFVILFVVFVCYGGFVWGVFDAYHAFLGQLGKTP